MNALDDRCKALEALVVTLLGIPAVWARLLILCGDGMQFSDTLYISITGEIR